VAEPADRRREDHHRRDLAGHLTGVVQGAGRQLDVVALDLPHGLARRVEQLRVERHRRDPEDVLELDRATLGFRRRGGGIDRLPVHRGQRLGVDVAHVHRDARLAGGRGDDARPERGAADGRDAVVGDPDVGDGEREAGRGAEAVTAHRHRHGAGVRGLAAEDQPLPLDALRAGDRADAEAAVLEHRSLLDVHLDIGLGVGHAGARRVEVLDVDPVRGEHGRELVAVAIGQRAQHAEVERPHRRRAPEEAAPEPGPLLVGPVDERHRHRRDAVGGQRAQQLEPGHHAECAVEPAALRDAVEVAAHDEHVRTGAGQHRPQVAGGVGVDLDGQRPQLLAEQGAGLQPLRRPRQAPRSLRPARASVELPEVGHDPGRVVRGGRRHRPNGR
jgi:hypothetical protein